MGGKGERDGTELRRHRKPGNSAIREEEMAAGASCWYRDKTGVVDRETRGWSKTNRKIREESVVRIDRRGWNGNVGCSLEDASSDWSWSGWRRRTGREMRIAFQRISRMKEIAIVSSRASSTVGKIQLESDFVMKGDKRVFVEAGEAVDVFHHPSWTMEDLEKIAKELLRPTPNLMNRTFIF
jgi:hypothetical protein